MLKKERFYAATVGKDAAEVIESYKTGVELDCFCWSVRLEEKDAIDEALGYMKLTNRHILHGPFTELYPAAIDPEAVDLAYKRLEQAYDISRRLGIDRMVVHSGYLPFIYFKEWHIEKSAQFWNNFMRNKDENFKIYIENVLEASVNPALRRFVLGFFRSISLWAQFRSPVRITGLILSS